MQDDPKCTTSGCEEISVVSYSDTVHLCDDCALHEDPDPYGQDEDYQRQRFAEAQRDD